MDSPPKKTASTKHTTSEKHPIVEESDIHKLMFEGVTLWFQLKPLDAAKFFEEHAALDIRFKCLSFLPRFWVCFSDGDLKLREKLLNKVGKVIKELEKLSHYTGSMGDMWKKKPVTEKERLAEYSACSMLAFMSMIASMVEFSSGSFISAGVSLRRSWKYYEECFKVISHYDGKEELDPHFISEVKLGYGLFQFSVSLFPPNLMFLIEALGFKGDRMGGWKMVHEVAQDVNFPGYLARIMLHGSYQFWLQESAKSLEICETTDKMFPEFTVSKYLSGLTYRFQGDIDKAIDCWSSLIKAAEQLPQFAFQIHYELGSTYNKRSDWKLAIENYEKFTAGNKGEAFRCLCGYELGVAYCFVGEYDKAVAPFKAAGKYVREDIPFELYAARKSKEFLNCGLKEYMSKWELAYFEMRERAKVAAWPQILKLAEVAKSEGLVVTPDQKACYSFAMGQAHRKLKDFEKAKPFLKDASEQKVKLETWVIPHALTELGAIMIEEGQTDQGVKLLHKVKSHYDGYDFRNILLREIALLLDKATGVNYCLL